MFYLKQVISTSLLASLFILSISTDVSATSSRRIKSAGHQITICHYPAGRSGNSHTISISSNSWRAHQSHGDSLGSCHANPALTFTPKCYTPTPTPTKTPKPTCTKTPTPTCTKTPTPTSTATPTPDQTPTPTPTPWVCGIGGPYQNLSCTGSQISVQVGTSDTQPSGSFSYLWTTDCLGGQFSDPHAKQPMLTLASSTSEGAPISCSVTLALVSDGATQASCSAIITTNQCQKDCSNVINGTAKYDECGICNGDGSSCACVEYQIAGEITELSSSFSLQCGTLDKLMKKLTRISCGSATRLAQIRKAMKKTCGSGKVQIRSIPTITGNCHTVCTLCSNEVIKSNLNTLSKKLFNLSREAVALDTKCARQGSCKRSVADCRMGLKTRADNQRQLQAMVNNVHSDAIESLTKIPGSTYSCTNK
jgi:hypothetical protein